jgi:hypothetical protein
VKIPLMLFALKKFPPPILEYLRISEDFIQRFFGA